MRQRRGQRPGCKIETWKVLVPTSNAAPASAPASAGGLIRPAESKMLELALGRRYIGLGLVEGNEVPQRQRKNHVLLNMSLTGSNATRASCGPDPRFRSPSTVKG
jgi:hypothetical protein